MKLLFITSSRIGDAVLSTGLLGHLVDRHPDLRATVVCSPLVASLFRAVPQVERVVAVPKARFGSHWLRVWPSMAARAWDLVVNIRNAPVALLTLRRRMVWFRDGPGPKVAQLGRMLGLDPPPAPRLWLADADVAEAARLIPDGGPVIGLGPTANWRAKEWPAERFVELAGRLGGPGGVLPGARFAVFSGPDERARAEPVIAGIAPGAVVDLAGRTSLPLAAACMRRLALYVGNDSGLMHMAAAMGTPTLGLFGPTPDEVYAPWGAGARAVRAAEPYEQLKKGGYSGPRGRSRLFTLEVEEVERACIGLLAAAQTQSPSGGSTR